MNTQYLLETSQLGLDYGAFSAVGHVDLKIKKGSIHTVIGPNGAGKTSLFHCLTGERKPSRGSIRFNGEDIWRLINEYPKACLARFKLQAFFKI